MNLTALAIIAGFAFMLAVEHYKIVPALAYYFG
jgi:hypothetical protein